MSDAIFQPTGRMMKGDELSSLTSSKPALLENIVSLWGQNARITCGHENRFAVIFENKDDARIIALAKLIEIQTGKGTIIGIVHDVIVDAEFPRQGLGTRLMTILLQYGRDNDFQRFELTCRPARERANQLYRKVGFVLKARAEDADGTNLYHYVFK